MWFAGQWIRREMQPDPRELAARGIVYEKLAGGSESWLFRRFGPKRTIEILREKIVRVNSDRGMQADHWSRRTVQAG
jgi:hypothetical protein